MTTAPRPVVLVVERLVLAAWGVIDLIAASTVLLLRVRQAARRGGASRPGSPGGAATVLTGRPVVPVARTLGGSWAV